MNKLSEICNRKREHVAAQKRAHAEHELLIRCKEVEEPRGFINAIQRSLAASKPALIAEIKKASPSKGLIREDFDPAALAKAYAAGGATCLSILTDIPYFQGADEYLGQARTAVSLPALRKDFMVDSYQIVESRALGADCILLIMAALSDAQAKELEHAAHELGMDVLVEVHDEEEFDRAIMHLSSPLLGINNRNLKTLEVDLRTSQVLAVKMPKEKIRVCESGINTNADILQMQKFGFQVFLVGESLMRQANVTQATRQLLGL